MFDPEGPVLGIDPGVSRCGYGAVASRRGGALGALAFGVIRTPRSAPLPERLALLAAELDRLVRDVRPSALAVERVLFQANTRTAMSVGQASGLALAIAGRARVPVFHYSPNEVKLAVTGDGRADKVQVQLMVARLLALAQAPRPADAADALALSVCHLGSAGLRTAAGVQVPVVDGLSRAVAAAVAKEGER
ncbi:MAG TPA: crossover junction endodeoxyribonuclease RuvC [Acidimicrobiia bacterium]